MRPELEINADEFIAVKGFKAKGKRITTYQLGEITELEPLRMPEPETESSPETIDNPEDEADSDETETVTGPKIIEGNLFEEDETV